MPGRAGATYAQSGGRFAGRLVNFLLGIRLANGAFPGMEIAENRSEPSPFDTGLIPNDLTARHRATGDVLPHPRERIGLACRALAQCTE